GFGQSLATQSQSTPTADLPTVLAGSSVTIQDASGGLRLAPLFFVGPTQINYLVPAGTASGPATATVATASGATATGTLQIAAVAPGLFTANGNGAGVAAATAIRINPDMSQSPVAVFQCGSAALSC